MKKRRKILIGIGIMLSLSMAMPVMATTLNDSADISEYQEAGVSWSKNSEGKWEITLKDETEKATDGVYKCGSYYYLVKDGILVTDETVEITEEDLSRLDAADKEIIKAGTYAVEPDGNTPENGMGSLLVNLGVALDTTPEPERTLNPGWQDVDGKWLYGNADGTQATDKTGWQEIKGRYYFLKADGSVDTSQNGIVENEGKYLSATNGVGNFASGFQNIGSATYYFLNGEIQKYSGWVSIDGKAYYFNEQNQIASQSINGWRQINGNWYWFENGRSAAGWRNIGSKWYYMDPATGIMKTGFFADTTGQKYYCDESGAMVGGGWHKLGNDWYWMHNSGAIATGWLKQGNTWYYLDPATGAMKTGWYEVGGQRYFSSGSGAMQTGWIHQGNTWYYLNASGAMHRGWVKLGNTWYYLDPASGVMRTGWYQDKGTWYYSNGSGAMQTGWIYQGNKWYYLEDSGAMAKGWKKLGSSWYYLDPTTGAMQTGWYQDGSTWYYSYGSGAMASNTWIGNYYLTSSGAMAVNTWIGSYYVGADGAWVPSKTQTDQNLKVRQQTDQIVFVEVSGTYAVVRLEEKDKDGNWSEILRANGRIGSAGLGKQVAGDKKTPVGVFDLGVAFGIKPDPGCPQGYTQVDNSHYWVGDSSSPYYNKFVSTRDVPLSAATKNSSEHIISYGKVYNYCIEIGYNRSCTPQKGSAIFLHCSGAGTTAGCVSVPESTMIQIIKRLHGNAKIAIGTAQDISNF